MNRQMEKDMTELWKNYQARPDRIEMNLESFRRVCAKYGTTTRSDTEKFLAETADVSERAIVVITPGSLSLLADDEGNLLEFA